MDQSPDDRAKHGTQRGVGEDAEQTSNPSRTQVDLPIRSFRLWVAEEDEQDGPRHHLEQQRQADRAVHESP